MRGKWYKMLLLGMSACILTACGSQKPAEKAKSEKIVVQETGDRPAETVSLVRTNQKVSPKISVERQLQVIIKERAIWWWKYHEEDDVQEPYYAVTDFDQDGYLEILVSSDRKEETVLYEINERFDALQRCKVSDKVFTHGMENPLGAYYEEKTDTWYYGEEGHARYTDKAKKTYIKKMYMQYEFERLYEEDEEEPDVGFTQDLMESWEAFAVYEPLDVSAWQAKLTTEELKQLHRIAETMKNFGSVDNYSCKSEVNIAAYNFEYAVCDLNQDGKLEILVHFLSGSGIVRDNYLCYEVREEEGVLNIMDEADRISKPDKYGENGFVSSQLVDTLTVYQNTESGEIYYGFEAAQEMGSSKWQEYKMLWHGTYLSIHPMKEEEKQQAAKKGEAHLCWVDRNDTACSDYQYENALASYLGWGIKWENAR